nr:unnamed protein product [Callosobruchus chinensis]
MGNADSKNILHDITSSVNPANLKVCINSTKCIKNGVAIHCKDDKSMNVLKENLANKLGSKYSINQAKKFNPRMIIKDVDLEGLESSEDILNSILSIHNFPNLEPSDIKFVTKLKQLNGVDVIIEVTPAARKTMLQVGHVFIGWKRSPVSDHLRIVKCSKCCSYGHLVKDCKSTDSVCHKCAGLIMAKQFDHMGQKQKKNLKIAVLNIRSLLVKFADFKNTVVNSDSLSYLCPRYDQMVCTGDFNIDFLDRNAKAVKLFDDSMDAFGLHQVITAPTRFGVSSETLLDLFFCSEGIECSFDITDVSNLSDHCLVSVDLQYLIDIKQTTVIRSYRDFKNFDLEAFKLALEETDFMQIVNCHDIDMKLDIFNHLVLDLFDKYAPYRTARFTKKPAPWLTADIKFLMKLRDDKFTAYRKTKSRESWEEYKELRNITNLTVNHAKKIYFEQKVSNTNYNRLWKDLKEMSFRNEKSKRQIPEDLADVNQMNQYFSSISNAGCDQTPNCDVHERGSAAEDASYNKELPEVIYDVAIEQTSKLHVTEQ